MQNNGLRSQYPANGDGLSPQPFYGYSPSSNYPSYTPGPAPDVEDPAHQGTPRYGSNGFIPPPDVFLDGQKRPVQDSNAEIARGRRNRSSTMLNNDPVAMHLLVETAITDSQSYEVLSFEELEALKKEQQAVNARIEAVQRKLALESKLRDAAQSLNRLYSRKGKGSEADKSKGHRRSFGSLGSSNSGQGDALVKTEDEIATRSKKCDDLSRELLQLEARARQIQLQLLQHTAGILQITHEGPSIRSQSALSNLPDGLVQGARPDSPASIYTYENGRSNRPKADDNFDERSLYRSPENLDGLMHALKNGTHHMTSVDNGVMEQQSQTLASVEKRLEELNDRLRELIVQANPERNQAYSSAPKITPGNANSQRASIVDQQLDFLDQGLRDIGAEQNNMRQKSRHSQNAVEGRLEGINNQLYAIISSSQTGNNEEFPPPPPISGQSAQEQINYMEEAFYNMEQLHNSLSQSISEVRSRTADQQAQSSQYEVVLNGLWSIILAGEEEARQRKLQRRQALAANLDAEDDLSPDEDGVPNEAFSLQAFSTKVQWIYNRATTLKEKESILRRQIKQQRELNSASNEQKEAEFTRLNDQIEQARSQQAIAERELERAMENIERLERSNLENQERNVAQTEAMVAAARREAGDQHHVSERELARLHEQLELLNLQNEQRGTSDSEALVAEQAARREAEDRYHALKSQIGELQDDARIEAAELRAELSEASANLEILNESLRTITVEKETAESRASEAKAALAAKEQELRELESEVVRLQTEVTVARAELDGAYGTRAQRAAEVAANPSIKKELDELGAKNISLVQEIDSLRRAQAAASQSETEARENERKLKQELAAMAQEYEALTKDSIQNEKDRDRFEAIIDSLRDEKESLEMELSDERVKWLGVRSPGGPNAQPGAGGAVEATSIRMLREDFRKMMRDRTAEGLKALRAEQEERRKLEAVVRTLKREQAPPKSSLSKTMTA
ncbi:hypothetical protein K432DRAFT_441693 [Lepidopterella palustris CBS 459.81]|uniref:Up-regulated during septation protein 1 domain-containing protein n=1 Tax=Lepidopterella palustris CBS 459.81 TaxID=1314670 RepID=A0A8E2JH24_9PEZI|nr:hypothetical protein K432DRAFT_441693 [Lepidopterella palustris CBS 459.81]